MPELDRLASLTLADFTPAIGTEFTLHRPDGATEPLKLAEANAVGAAGADKTRAPFALLFRTSARGWMPQAIYALEHPALGRLEIFLVPLGPDAQGMRYEAVFT